MTLFRLRIYARMLVAAWSTFGLGRDLLVGLFRKPLVGLLGRILFRLDNVFFPGLRRVEVRKPVFIVGHPRSGTTFLHRLLAQTGEFAVFRFWEIILPSLVARKIFGPFVAGQIRKGKGVFFPKEVGHEVALDSVEEEELLFIHTANTQFMLIGPLAFSDWDFAELVYCDEQPERLRKKTVRFFKQCLQRQIYDHGKTQVVAKLNYSGMRLRSLLEEFPDAKIIYMVRSPYETIPSHLSLHRNMFDHQWGLENIPADRLQRYFQRRYRYNVAFYRYLEDLLGNGSLDASRLMVLPYETLRNDLEGAVRTVVQFADLKLSDNLWAKIREESQAQRHYRREHRNLPLEDFGLSKERIAEDLRFVFEKYGFEM